MHGNTATKQFRWCIVLWSTLQQKGSEIWPFYCTCMTSCFTVFHKPWYHSILASVYEIISLYHISNIYKERDSLDHPNSVVYSCFRVLGEWKSFLRNPRSVFITTVETYYIVLISLLLEDPTQAVICFVFLRKCLTESRLQYESRLYLSWAYRCATMSG